MKRMFSCSSSQVAVESWNKQDQKLLEAVEKGDVGRVGALAARKTARPAKLNALGQSAFHLAASKGLTECLTLLLAHGAPVNEKNDDGSTALHLATIACQPQCVKVLLQHGANESHVDGQNRTPLHWAASSGCASSVLLLCDHEALLDVTDADGQTPLMLAAWGNHAAICAQLLQRGADPHLADKDKRTALALACQHGSVESAELLLRHGAAMGDEERRRYAAQTPSRALRRLLRGAHHRCRANGTGCAMDPVPQGASQGAGCPGSSSEEEEDEEQEDGCDAQRVRQLRERLARKTRECQRLVADANSIRQRVREVAQLLPSCDTGDGMGDEAGTCLALLAQHVGELRRRLAAKEEGDGGHRLTAQLSEAMGQLGGKTVAQLGGDATAQLGGKAMAQLGDKAMAQLNGKNVTQLGGNAMAHLGTEATVPALASFLTWLGDECAKLRAARASALARSRGLRKEVEEALRSKLHYEVVPAGAVRRSLAAWEKLALGLEQALGCADQTHAKILEGSRAFLGTLQQHPVTSTAPVLGRESRLELRKEAGSVEQELAELKESNKMLLGELAQLGRQRERLREELRVLREQDPGAQLVAAEGSGVAALAQALAAEREEASRLRRRLAGQRRELAALRDGVGERAREASSAPGAAGAAILRELHRKLDGLVRSQHEALQLVAEMEGDEDGDGGGGLLGKLEDGLGELGEELVPVASPREPEGARAEAERWRAVAAEEKRAKEAAEVRVAQQERELRELQEKAEGLEQSVGTLRERAGQLARACRDKEGTMKKLLAETEKLSAEVLGLRSRSTQLQLQLELQQKNHRDTVAVYRTHLLNAAQGFMDQGVHAMLLHILRSQE